MSLNTRVRDYWEHGACGTTLETVKEREPMQAEWFTQLEAERYRFEPFIHSVAQFTRHHGKKLLEVGVGAGADHLQWARAGVECHGVDLTNEAIKTTTAHLALHGFQSCLQRVDAEELPFESDTFDIVYSWGVIHHSEHPERIIAEIRRVLRPGGTFVGMMYGRYSLAALKCWVRNALLKGRPWRTLSDVLYHHVESVGTKAYTIRELGSLFDEFELFSAQKFITPYDKQYWPKWLAKYLPNNWGWFVAIQATK